MRLIIELPLVNENCKHQAWFAVKNEAQATTWVNAMIKVLFFAQVRELVGTDSLTLDASELATVEAVRQQLAARGDRWALALEEGKLLAAVNQTLTSFEHPVASGDEVAFFPPVTGG